MKTKNGNRLKQLLKQSCVDNRVNNVTFHDTIYGHHLSGEVDSLTKHTGKMVLMKYCVAE